MTKKKIESLFKPGYKFKVRVVDTNDSEVQRHIRECHEQQEKIAERKRNGGRYPRWL